MESAIFKCKLITPMFMSGADSDTPELRPSEFKGMMRFWWRAVKAEDNIEHLKKEEAQIFGGTGEGEGRSKVWIRIKCADLDNFLVKCDRNKTIKEEYRLDWHFDGNTKSLQGNHAGIGYLWYSTYLKNNERGFIKPQFEFEIRLVANNREFLSVGTAALWLAIYLGGFGTRSKRGAGNLEIVEANLPDKDLPEFRCSARNKKELKDFLVKNFSKVKKICEQAEGTFKYSTLKNTKVIILDPYGDWISALNFLGKEYQKFRIAHKKQIFEVSSFGMPIIHTSNPKVRLVPYQKVKSNPNRLSDRLGSPVIFKLIKAGNLYFPVIIKLSPGGVKYIGLEERKGKEWELVKVENFSENIIYKFLDTFKNKEEILL